MKMPKAKKVYILGAGFSYHKTKILAKDYITEIEEISKERSIHLGHNPEVAAKRITEFFKKEQISSMCDLELLFSNIDNAIDGRKITCPFVSSLEDLKEIKNDIRVVLREIFFDTQRDTYSDEIIKFCSLLTNGDFIITFNYDCLLENSIYWAKFIEKRDDIPLFNPLKGYLLNFDSHNIDIDLFDRKDESDIKILKLHGSVNWSRNNYGRNICLYEITRDNPIANYCMNQAGQALHDSSNRAHLWMIEPSYNKNISEFIVLWKEAEKQLSKTDEIIIIGYSFPDADFSFQHIFQKAIRNNEKSPKFRIIDPNAEVIEEKIKKLLGLDDVNVEICKNTFEDWIKK